MGCGCLPGVHPGKTTPTMVPNIKPQQSKTPGTWHLAPGAHLSHSQGKAIASWEKKKKTKQTAPHRPCNKHSKITTKKHAPTYLEALKRPTGGWSVLGDLGSQHPCVRHVGGGDREGARGVWHSPGGSFGTHFPPGMVWVVFSCGYLFFGGFEGKNQKDTRNFWGCALKAGTPVCEYTIHG